MSDLTEDLILSVVGDSWLLVENISTIWIEESSKGFVVTNVVAPSLFPTEYSIEPVVYASGVVWNTEGVEVSIDVVDADEYFMDWEITVVGLGMLFVAEVYWLIDDSDWLNAMWLVSVLVTVYPAEVSKSVKIELSVVFMVVLVGDMEDSKLTNDESATSVTAPVLLERSWLVVSIEDRWSIKVTAEEERSVVSSASTDVDDCWPDVSDANDDVTTWLAVVYSDVDAKSNATLLE